MKLTPMCTYTYTDIVVSVTELGDVTGTMHDM